MPKSNVIAFSKVSKPEAPRTCDFHTISDNGKSVHGQAALKVIMKRAGGPDAFLENYGVRVANGVLADLAKEFGGRQIKRAN